MADRGVTLRPASRDDAEFLTDMLVEAVNWDPGRRPLPRDQALSDERIALYVADWPRPGDLGVIALESSELSAGGSLEPSVRSSGSVEPGGRPVGAAWLRVFTVGDPGYGFVAPDVPELSVAVLPSARGRGVGRALLRALARRAADAGYERISLSVERGNPAKALYTREGFTTVASDAGSDTMVKTL